RGHRRRPGLHQTRASAGPRSRHAAHAPRNSVWQRREADRAGHAHAHHHRHDRAAGAMKRVFLVDDEALALRRLARMLEATQLVEIVGQSTDPEEALDQIAAHPDLDLVFLDISMPTLDGFDVCARLPPTVMVVFTTAYDEHALRAFQTNAI